MAVKIVEGEIFKDVRGRIASLNDFSFDGVKRVYFIHHPDTSIVRGWHGHKLEKKFFYCVKGKFTIGLVKIDNWETPSRDLVPEVITLCEEKSRIICVPAGYASRIKAEIEDSALMVLSDKTLEEAMALQDSYRFDKDCFLKGSN